MASLGWVSPGAATEGVTPIFLKKKLTTFLLLITVCQFCGVTFYFLEKTDDLFAHHSLLLISLGYHPLEGCHPAPFLPVRPRLATIRFFKISSTFLIVVSHISVYFHENKLYDDSVFAIEYRQNPEMSAAVIDEEFQRRGVLIVMQQNNNQKLVSIREDRCESRRT